MTVVSTVSCSTVSGSLNDFLHTKPGEGFFFSAGHYVNYIPIVDINYIACSLRSVLNITDLWGDCLQSMTQIFGALVYIV